MLAARSPTAPASPLDGGGARPVLLATFDVPFAPEAAELAVDAALEAGQPLLLVNCVASALLPYATLLGYEYVERPDLEEALRAPAGLAASLGVRVERLRLVSPRPLTALLELVTERAPSLLVLGPDRRGMRRRAYRKAARRVREEATCLVWVEDDPELSR